jgi:hypothetical protein
MVAPVSASTSPSLTSPTPDQNSAYNDFFNMAQSSAQQSNSEDSGNAADYGKAGQSAALAGQEYSTAADNVSTNQILNASSLNPSDAKQLATNLKAQVTYQAAEAGSSAGFDYEVKAEREYKAGDSNDGLSDRTTAESLDSQAQDLYGKAAEMTSNTTLKADYQAEQGDVEKQYQMTGNAASDPNSGGLTSGSGQSFEDKFNGQVIQTQKDLSNSQLAYYLPPDPLLD